MKKLGPILLIGGGAAALGAFLFGAKKSSDTVSDIEQAVSGDVKSIAAGGTGGWVKLRLTGYWPFTARADEKKMEGGVNDRKGKPLHTLEDYLAGKAEFVSLSGDDAVWPYGQKVIIPWGDRNIIGRVVDTGSHFRGPGKLYRVLGYEPMDVCVASAQTVVPKLVSSQIVPGDNYAGGAKVATGGIKNQTIVGGVFTGLLGEDDYTDSDREALGRALESELGGRPREEMVVAAWAMRNRAEEAGSSLADMLAPMGAYGPPDASGGYASTRRAASDRSLEVARAVLSLRPSADPTGGAVEYWVPEQQTALNQLGAIHRAALLVGDTEKAKKYARYAFYGSESDVRKEQQSRGLRPLDQVGIVEILGRDL
jgi:hypothetical protein